MKKTKFENASIHLLALIFLSFGFVHTVYTAQGDITTVAGNGEQGSSGDGGSAANAQLGLPRSIAVDITGNIYISDPDNHRIRKVDATSGLISTVAGDGFTDDRRFGRFSGDGGPATDASLNTPTGIFIDTQGNLYIADRRNHRIRKVDATSGIISTVAGDGFVDDDGLGRFSGDGELATETSLNEPTGVFIDRQGNLYVADRLNHRVRKVNAVSGIISTVAGNEDLGFSGDGGPAIDARLNNPIGIFVDRHGTLFISDTLNRRVRRVDISGTITTVAGGNAQDSFRQFISGFSGDGGPAIDAELSNIKDIFVDSGGSLYIADENNHRIRKVDTSGIITTVAGDGFQDTIRFGVGRFSGEGSPATEASLHDPKGVFVDSQGNLYIADEDNHRVRMVERIGAPTVLVSNFFKTTDFTGDNKVDFSDFLEFLNRFGQKKEDPDFDPKFDLDNNEEVGFSDFLIFAEDFGKS